MFKNVKEPIALNGGLSSDQLTLGQGLSEGDSFISNEPVQKVLTNSGRDYV
jgi:hypothetical protein